MDIPYAGPQQTSYQGPVTNVQMDWGDYPGLVNATGSVIVASETSKAANGTLSVHGVLYYEHQGPVTINGSWACRISE